MIKGIIFDFYGVIYSNFDWTVVNERIYSKINSRREFRNLIKLANLGEIGNEDLLVQASSLAEDELYPDNPAVLETPVINYEALKLISGLKDKYKTGLLSNGSRLHIEAILKQCDAKRYFDVVMTSADSGEPKPAAGAFKAMIRALGIETAEALVVDDSPRHVAGARSAGIEAIQYKDIEDLATDLMSLGVLDRDQTNA